MVKMFQVLLYITKNSIKHPSFVYIQLNDQTVIFQTIQHNLFVCTQFKCSIWPIDKTQTSATTPGQSEPGSNGNEEVLHIPQSSTITGASLLDCLMSYSRHSLRGAYPSVEIQSPYSTALPDWAGFRYCYLTLVIIFITYCYLTQIICLPSLNGFKHSNISEIEPHLRPSNDTWSNLTVCKQISSNSHWQIIYIYIYIYI